MENRGSSAIEVTLSFLLGTAAGFILGVLFAPASGEDTRKKIQEGATKSGEKAKDSYDRITKEAEKGIEMVKEKTTEGVSAIKDFVDKKKEEFSKKIPEFSSQEEEKK
ncbi:MAG: YtxH domain-containing protein [Candidatus Aminicenantaceae bacterium]|jgi:gas vesicle protein